MDGSLGRPHGGEIPSGRRHLAACRDTTRERECNTDGIGAEIETQLLWMEQSITY